MFAAAALISLPLLVAGAQGGHSLDLNLIWGRGFADQIAAGTLYPRWLPELNHGAGSPVFFFYGPIPYYIASLGFLGCAGCDPTTQLGIGQWLVVVMSALTFYIFARGHGRPAVAVPAAVLYAVMPYHLYIDIMVRQAFAEGAAFIWLPLIFHFAERLPRAGALAGLAVSYSLLIATHMPTTVLCSMFVLGYVCLRAWQDRSAAALPSFAAAIVVGILLAGVYFVPAMFSQDYASLHVLWEGYYRYDRWFLLDSTGFASRLSDHILAIVILYSAAFLAAWAVAFRYGSGSARRFLVAWLLVFAGGWFILTPISLPLWQLLPVLQKVQQPWRVVSLMDFSVAATALAALAVLPSAARLGRAIAIGTMAFLLLLSAGLSATGGLVAWQVRDVPAYREDQRESLQAGYDSPEYLPAWVGLDQEQAWDRLASMPRTDTVPGHGHVQPVEWAPRSLLIDIDIPAESQVTLRQFYYPGWQATNVESGRQIPLAPAPETGLLRFQAPAGRYAVRLELTPLWQERVGQVCSVLGLLVLAAIWLRRRALRLTGRAVDLLGPVSSGERDGNQPVPLPTGARQE